MTDLDDPPNPDRFERLRDRGALAGAVLVTDAAGNELDLIGADGRLQTRRQVPERGHLDGAPAAGVLPPGVTALPAEAVPTSVAVGPDGVVVCRRAQGLSVHAGRVADLADRAVGPQRGLRPDRDERHHARSTPMGSRSITGLDFGPDGSLYVVEIVKAGVFNLFIGGDTTGALIKVTGGVRTELAPGQLHAPGDVAIARNGTVYVTNLSVSPNGGQVLAIP